MAVTLLIIFVTNVGVTRGQSAADIAEAMQSGESSVYGAAPMATDDEEGRAPKPDSLKKERKPIKPLESYFFDDSVRSRVNFRWNINRNFNRASISSIDTLLADFHIDYPYNREGVGAMSLGGLGQASQPINYYDRAKYYDFSYAQPYAQYIFTMENAPFYNVKKAFTQMSYLEAGQKTYREANFRIIHAQNITPSTGFAIDYKSQSTKGQYQRQDTKNHNLAVTASHTGKRYSVHAGYINNTIKTEEGGGVVGLWTVRDSLFEMPIGIPMKLGDAEASNTYRNNSIFVVQSYGIPLEPMSDIYDFSMADKSAVYFGHSFEYNYWSKVYKDTRATYTNDRYAFSDGEWISNDTLNYYHNWYIDPDNTRDSLRERVISNRLFVQGQPWGRNAVVGVVDGGIGIDFSAYNHFGLNTYLTGEYTKTTRTAWFVYGAAEGKYRKYLKWDGDFKLYPTGYRAGDMTANGNVLFQAYIKNKPITLSGAFKFDVRSPSYWQENLFSNHYVFLTPLDKENETRFEIKLNVPAVNLELGASQAMVGNMIYYDNDSNITQTSDVVSLTSLYLRKKFQFGGLNLDHKILGQWTTNEIAAPLPEVSVFLSYYYQFWLVKNVLRLQTGADIRYTSAYYMPDYNPALSTFFNQREQSMGGYPYMDVYVGAKWKRMRILIKYQHINNNLFGNGEYFEVANYPQNPGMLRFGISWSFYD